MKNNMNLFYAGAAHARTLTQTRPNSMERVFLEALIVAQLIKKFPAYFGTR
jgi:hypothetical protein